jgi:hypothetical protein
MATYAQDVPADLNETLANIKKLDSIKQDFIKKNINSKNAQNKALAESFKKQLDNDTSVMLETSEDTGKRINKEGKVYGPKMKKEDSGLYVKEVPEKMKKGGSISSASKRADGCAMRGKTRA